MNSLSEEIFSLREDVERLKIMISEMGIDSDHESTLRNLSKGQLEDRLGLSFARLIRSGPFSAVRPWLSSWRVKHSVTSLLGIKSPGFMSGLMGGLWSFGVGLLFKGIKRLMRKQRSPLLEARDPQDFHFVDDYDLQTGFHGSLDTELVRGKGFRRMMRDEFFNHDSLENQLRRGVVGL